MGVVESGRFIESPDGTVTMPLYVCLTEEALDPGVTSTVLARSYDGGRTWSSLEVSLVLEGQQKLVLLPDGGIALAPRGNPCVHISYDEGRTWNYALAGGGRHLCRVPARHRQLGRVWR